MSRLRLENISKSYGSVRVLDEISLDMPHGEFLALLGPSGCGKSTLLRIIAGLADQTSGQVWLGERDISQLPPAKRGIAMVFQTYALYPHMTVEGNLSLGLKRAKFAKEEVKRRVAEAARVLELGPLMKRRPAQLSGGQRQRVAIGRAIVREPDAFLFDEPLSNLDAALRSQVRTELSDLHRRLGATMVYVTHDQIEAMTLAQRIVVLDGGVVQQIGTPVELYQKPANRFVAGFIGTPKMNFLSGTAGDGKLEIDGVGTLPWMGKAKGDVVVGVRPSEFDCRRAKDAALAGRLIASEYLGSECILRVALPNDEIVQVIAKPDHGWTIGDELGLLVECLHVFDSRSGHRLGGSRNEAELV